MSYNLKDHINEWVNIELSIDNTNNQAEIFINGSKKDTITYDKKLTKNSQSKLHFGSKADRSKGFRGKLENINISNSKTNETISSAKYNQLKGNSKKQMFNMNFKNTSSSSRKVSERSKYKSSAKFNKPDGETGATLVANEGKDAVNFSSGDFMEIDAGASMNGELLKNSTFTSWVKLPSSSSGYEPIISRENVFSFGVNNGHASLFLSQNNQLAPGANITKPERALMVMDETFAKATFGQNDSLVKVNKNGSVVNNVIESDMIEYSGVANSKALKLTTNDKVEIDKLTYTGRDLSKFSMSMWMKPDQLSDNLVLFSRPEIGLALKANSSGKLNLEYTALIENKIQLSHVVNTSSTGSSSYKSSVVKAPNTTYTFLSNVNDSRMGTTTQKIYDNISFADDTVTIYMKYTTGSTYQPTGFGSSLGEAGGFFHTGVNGNESFPRMEFHYMGKYNSQDLYMYALGIDGNSQHPCEVRLQFKAPSPAINTEYEIMMTVSKTQLDNASISNSNGSARVYLDGVLLDDDVSKTNYISTFKYTGNITTPGYTSKSYSDLAIPRMKNATEHYGYGDAVINQLGFFDGDVPYGTMTISQPSTIIPTISTLQIYNWNGTNGLFSTTNGPKPISSYIELDGGGSSNPYFMINLDKFYKVHGVQIHANASYGPFKTIEYRVGTSTSSYESFSGYQNDYRNIREFKFDLANSIDTNKLYLGFISSNDIYNLMLHSLVVYGETVPTE